MLTIPSIASTVVIRKRSLKALKTHIGTTHDCLTKVIEAVDHVPVVILLKLVAGRHAGVDSNDGV